MRKLSYMILAALIFLPLLCVDSWAYEDEIGDLSSTVSGNMDKIGRKRVAVADFTDPKGVTTPLGKYLADELSTNIKAIAKKFEVLERAQLQSILTENKLSLSTPYKPEEARKIGDTAKAGAIVTGSITVFQDSIRVTIELISTYAPKVVVSKTVEIPKTKRIIELLLEAKPEPPVKEKELEPAMPEARMPAAKGLVAYYPFDGDFRDGSGSGNHGTPRGDMSFTEGAIGKGARFQNKSWITVNDGDSLDLAAAFTFSVWLFKEDAGIGGWAVVLSKGDTSDSNNNSPYGLSHDPSGVYPDLRLVENNSVNEVRADVKTNFKEWYLLTVTWDGNYVKYFVNGNLENQKTWKGILPNSSHNLLIGSDPPGATEYFNGIMDDLRIYNYALSDSEVRELYRMRGK